jgi:alkylation response protein AidB-like acyl-CoA dehydrogenase
VRSVEEIIAAADPATWLVQAQHQTPVALLAAAAGSVRRLLRPLASGELIAGMAFAHVRRYPDRPVTASRVRGGWRFDGATPWYTGWGINDLALMAGVDDDDHVVLAFIRASPSATLRASAPLPVAALAAANTVRLELDGAFSPDDDVLMRLPYRHWNGLNRSRMIDTSPAVFGVTAAALRLLSVDGSAGTEMQRLAEHLTERLDSTRRRCYYLADIDLRGEMIRQRIAARADAYALLTAATTAAVAAGGGTSLTPQAPAQRLARAGLFLLVYTQTAAVQAATMRRWREEW